MTWQDLVKDVLLALGVGVEWLCCLGLLLGRTALDRLHYLGPATLLGPLLIAAAVVVHEALSQAGIKAILLVLAFLISSPVLSHATGRAARLRGYGNLRPRTFDRRGELES